MSIRTPARRARWVLAALCLATLTPTLASAQNPLCSSLPSPVYGIGGSAQTPLMQWIGATLAGGTPAVTVVYADPSACNGISAIVPINGTTNPDQTALNTATAKYWDVNGVEHQCDLPGKTGGTQVFDFGLMGNGPTLCAGITQAQLTGFVGDYYGPTSSVSVIVHQDSTETSISSSAIAAVYSRTDPTKRPAPWNLATELYRRSPTSYVQIYLSIAANIGTTFQGLGAPGNTNDGMALAVGDANGTAAAHDARFGFVSSEVADKYASTVNALAYQHDLGGQTCGYWPDSTAAARDKINVRNGQYYLWGASHFYARTDTTGATGNHVSAAAQDLIGWIRTASGHPVATTNPIPANTNLLAAIIHAGNIPECAMQVSRATDLGAISSFAPTEPCGCYFEKQATGVAPASCVACNGANPCSGSSVCRHGYCEAN